VLQKICALFPQISFICTWEYEDDPERYFMERMAANSGED